MPTQLLAEAAVATSERDAEERALRNIEAQLSLAYPTADPAHIAALLRANYDRTQDARVQLYRLVLAERATRVRLRREA